MSARSLVGVAVVLMTAVGACRAPRYFEQTYLPATHNRVFRERYDEADRVLNAIDYGHAVAVEALFARPKSSRSELEGRELAFITRSLLVRPPALSLDVAALAPTFTTSAPDIHLMFEWAHMLHRQLYDVLADERIPDAKRDAYVSRVLRYYQSRRDVAITTAPKSMEPMEGRSYSGRFRAGHPTFNGLIWSYHWLQMSLYDALLMGQSGAERKANVASVLTRFRSMVDEAPEGLPTVMPMSAAIAPAFTERYPDAAIVFDNLHAMHDVVSDILADERLDRDAKRAALREAGALYRDSMSFVLSRSEWLAMSIAMGADRMGGAALGRAHKH